MIYIILALIPVIMFALSMTGKGPDLYWNQIHHEYYGWLFIIVGLIWAPLYWIGLVLCYDDSIQHALQNVSGWENKRPSLINWLYGFLYKIPAVSRFNKWLDSKFKEL